jgi:hypothetical protein
VQRKLDKQFARDVEESIRRRGLEAPPILSPTPAPRPKRAAKGLARFDGLWAKRIGRRIRGRGDRCNCFVL